MHDGGDRKFMPQRIRRRVVQVPNKTVHPGCPRENLRRAHPVHGNGMLAGGFFQRLGLVRARILPHELIVCVENLECHRLFREAREVIIDDGAIGRIFAGGKFRRQWRIGVSVPTETNRFLRCEEMHTFFRDVGVQLPQRRDIIQNPERAAVRGDNKIVAMNREIAHRSVRQIQLQRLPIVSIVEGNVHGAFRSGEEQTLARRIFAHYVAGAAIGNIFCDFRPRLAEIARAVNMRAQIVEPERIDRRVRRACIEVRSFDNRNFAPRLELRRRYILPGLSAVARDLNQPIISSRPDGVRLLERRSDCVNNAAVFSFFRIARGENAEVRGNFVGFAREIRTDDLPTVSRVGSFEKHVGREVERVRFERRKHHRQRARIAILAAANRLRRNLRVLADILLRSRKPVAIKNVRVERIDGDISVFKNTRQAPIAKCNFAVVAAALRRDGAAFLLGAVNPIGKAIIGGDVIELGGWLIVPTAPRRAAVHADDRALIGAERDDLRIFRADPDALVVVAARRTFEPHKCFSTVRRLPRRSVRDVNDVRIVRRDGDARRARTAATDAAVGVYLFPRFAGIIGTVDTAIFLCFHGGVNAVRLAVRNGNADAAQTIGGRGETFGERAPIASAIGGFENAAAGTDEGFTTANLPWRNARGPQHRVNRLRIRGIESKVGGASVLILVEDFLERLAAVGRTENAALGVRAVGMSFGGDKNAVGIFRVDEDRGDLLGVAEVWQMRPGFSGIGGFVYAIAGREIGALQSFATAHVNNVRIGRSNSQCANGAAGLVVENRIPGVSEIGGLPDAAVDGGHVENVELVRDPGNGHGAAAAERADAAPAHFGIELLIELLRVRRSATNSCDDDSSDEPLPCHTDAHPSPPREERGYSGRGNGAMRWNGKWKSEKGNWGNGSGGKEKYSAETRSALSSEEEEEERARLRGRRSGRRAWQAPPLQRKEEEPEWRMGSMIRQSRSGRGISMMMLGSSSPSGRRWPRRG